MHNGYCFGLGQKFGQETEIIDPETQNTDYFSSDYDRMRIWFDKRDIEAYSAMPVIINSHSEVQNAYERDLANPLQLTYQNERYQFNANLHGTTKSNISWDQIEVGPINQVEMHYGKRTAGSDNEYIAGFKLLCLNEGKVYTVPQSLDEEIDYYGDLYRSEIGDNYFRLGSDKEAKIVGFQTTQNGTSSSARITSLQFIYLTQSQEVCNHFTETLYVDRIFTEDAEQTEWFHWSYIVAVCNFLVFLIAFSGAIWCCRRMIRTRRLLSVAKKQAISPINDFSGTKTLNTVHALNLDSNISKQNESYYNDTVKKMVDPADNIIENSDADVELRLSHSAKMSKKDNQDVDDDEDSENENDRSRHVQFNDSPRIRAISIHKNNMQQTEEDGEDHQEETNAHRDDVSSKSHHSNRSRQSVEVLPQDSGIGNMRQSWQKE